MTTTGDVAGGGDAIGIAEQAETAAALEQAGADFLAGQSLRADPPVDPAVDSTVDPAVDAVLARLAEQGWFAALLPDDEGGLGLRPAAVIGLLRVAARHRTPGPLLEHVLLAPWLHRRADPDARRLLEPALAGTAALAFADPECFRRTSGERDALRLDAAGRLHGEVALVSHAPTAPLLAVAATNPEGTESVVLVPAAAPGLSVRPREPLTPLHPIAAVTADGVAGESLSGEQRAGDLAGLRAWLRVGVAAWLAGICERVLDLTVEYVGSRKQFGQPIGDFQAVQHTVADMATRTWSALNLVSMAADRLDDFGKPEELSLATKAHAAEASLRVCEQALQMHGGIGFTAEYELRHFYTSALALHGAYGGAEDLFLRLGRRALRDG